MNIIIKNIILVCLALLFVQLINAQDAIQDKDNPNQKNDPTTGIEELGDKKTTVKTETDSPKVDNKNGTLSNLTTGNDSFYQKMLNNKGMLYRTMYVLMAVTGVVVLYFGVKYCR